MKVDKTQKRKYFGKTFYKESSGYWVNLMPIHAHRWVWICHHGMPPQGYDVHHKDGDKSNNEIDNLEILTRSEHLKRHWQNHHELERRLQQLASVRPIEWLKSPEGKKAVSEQGKTIWKNRLERPVVCGFCGDTKLFKRWARFCSKKCYMKWRWRNRDSLIK